MKPLRWVPIASLLVALIATVANLHWEARLYTNSNAYILDLDHPNFRWPEVPKYQAFQVKYENLPKAMPRGFQIVRLWVWDGDLFMLLFWLWCCSSLFGFVYFPRARQLSDPVLHAFAWLGIGLPSGMALCFVVYLLVGGWGPPAPLGFAILGLVIGIMGGRYTWDWVINTPLRPNLSRIDPLKVAAFLRECENQPEDKHNDVV